MYLHYITILGLAFLYSHAHGQDDGSQKYLHTNDSSQKYLPTQHYKIAISDAPEKYLRITMINYL